MWAQVSFVLTQSTCLTDGQTDRQTEGQNSQKGFGISVCPSVGNNYVRAL